MRFVRTFHSVGHGAFYTERFYDDSYNNPQNVANFVYDCGSITDLQKLQQEINREFNQGTKIINAVFISHFHEDHINGLGHLLGNCTVQNIVIPKMPQDFIIYAMIQNALIQKGGPSSTANDILSSILSEEGHNNEEFQIVQIGEDDDNDTTLKGLLPPSLKDIWEYRALVLTCKSQKYKNRLHSLTQSLQQDAIFRTAFKSNGIIDYPKFNHLLKNNNNLSHLRGLVSQYNLNGNHYNMVVGSEPTDKTLHMGCLFTGDAMLKCKSRMKQLVGKYAVNSSLYHCLQVPHHGVVGDNHNAQLYTSPKECIVSVKDGDPNRPAATVKNDITINGGNCVKVTEKTNNLQYQHTL